MSSTKDIIQDPDVTQAINSDALILELRVAKQAIESFDNRIEGLDLEWSQKRAMDQVSLALTAIVHAIEIATGEKENA